MGVGPQPTHDDAPGTEVPGASFEVLDLVSVDQIVPLMYLTDVYLLSAPYW